MTASGGSTTAAASTTPAWRRRRRFNSRSTEKNEPQINTDKHRWNSCSFLSSVFIRVHLWFHLHLALDGATKFAGRGAGLAVECGGEICRGVVAHLHRDLRDRAIGLGEQLL